MFELASYHAPGRPADRLVRIVTDSIYSHSELAIDRCLGLSSSGRDGGVRLKPIDFDEERWNFVPLSEDQGNLACSRIFSQLGLPYDWAGIFLSHLLPLDRHAPGRWFCSEILAYGFGYDHPHRYSPGKLHARQSLDDCISLCS